MRDGFHVISGSMDCTLKKWSIEYARSKLVWSSWWNNLICKYISLKGSAIDYKNRQLLSSINTN
jgi:hypothetical protein